MYYPPSTVSVLAAMILLVDLKLILTAPKAFDHLTINYLYRMTFIGLAALVLAIGFIGAVWGFSKQNPILFVALSGFGILTWFVTAWKGFAAGQQIHHAHLKKRTRSIDWNTSIYDADSNSLDSVDVNDSILNSVPTWKLLFYMALAMSPGPIVAILAGKVSKEAHLILGMPAAWGSTMVFGYMLLRLAIDWWPIRQMEKQRGVRLILSSSASTKKS